MHATTHRAAAAASSFSQQPSCIHQALLLKTVWNAGFVYGFPLPAATLRPVSKPEHFISHQARKINWKYLLLRLLYLYIGYIHISLSLPRLSLTLYHSFFLSHAFYWFLWPFRCHFLVIPGAHTRVQGEQTGRGGSQFQGALARKHIKVSIYRITNCATLLRASP